MPRNISGTFSERCFCRSSSIAICICHRAEDRAPGVVVRDGLVAGNTTMIAFAHELVDDAVVLDDDLGQRGEAAVQRVEDHARRVGLGDGGEPAQVGEQESNLRARSRRRPTEETSLAATLCTMCSGARRPRRGAPAHGFGDEILDPPDRVLDDPALGQAAFLLLVLTFL
jgi:hypothetical protein